MYREDLAENCKQLVLITFFSRIAFNQIFADRWNCTFQLNLMMDWEAKETEKKCHWNRKRHSKKEYLPTAFLWLYKWIPNKVLRWWKAALNETLSVALKDEKKLFIAFSSVEILGLCSKEEKGFKK